MARSRARTRLPHALTPLLGRSKELAETASLLEGTRLLTITGAGGSGKTRLALELAHRVRDAFEDVIWVELAPVGDPDLIGQQILDAMGVRELAAEDVLQVVVDAVRDRTILFVLDNCEHLVEPAAYVVEEILRSCANAKVVTTTREALGVRGEQTWLVPPLSVEDAVQLFHERARSANPSFKADDEVIAQICRRLDGIPLAIELAAARVKVLRVEEIAARLDDAFRLLSWGSRTMPRHRTIRETIDWSYRLLSSDEQVVLRRLAVFGASFSLDAVESICGEGVDVLTHLSALVDKSLVIAEEARYRLLDTVRQFAQEKLAGAGEQEALRRKHARYFVAFGESLEPHVFAGAVDPAALALIDAEIGNFRAVFDSGADVELEARLLYALHWYWFARAHFHEARRRVAALWPRLSAWADDTPERKLILAKAQIAAANAAAWQGDWASVRPGIDEAVETLRGADDERALAMALTLLGSAQAFADGDHGGAAASFKEARQHARDVGLALTLYWSGAAAQLREDWESARKALEQAHALGVSLGNKPAIAHPLSLLGHIELREGNREAALRSFREAFDVFAELDDRWGLTQVVEGIGLLLLGARNAETGTRLLAAASAAWLHLGARPGRDAQFEDEKNERIREALDDARLRIVLASGAAMTYDAMVALSREHLGKLDTPAETPLRVRALGPLEILRDGEPVEESARSRELLLFLLCHPTGRTKEQIGAALWPDADPAKLRNNFHVTLHRLRKSLGAAEWITTHGDTYTLDRTRGVDFDAEAFEREANAAVRARDAARLTAAVALYRGDFFENATSGEWYLERRDRLRDLYARALDTLGKLRMTAGDYPAAAEAYEKLVALDNLDEEAARSLIRALEKQGDKTGATRAYRRLADALKRELGERPSFEL